MNNNNNIRISSNKRNRTYTIYENGLKFRTYPMSREEFDNDRYNTIGDWKAFLRYSQDYYQVK